MVHPPNDVAQVAFVSAATAAVYERFPVWAPRPFPRDV